MPKRVLLSPEKHMRLLRESLLQKEQELLNQLEQVRTKLRRTDELAGVESVDAPTEFMYAGMDFIDAFLDHLDRTGRAQKEDDLIKAVIARGAYLGRGKGAKGSAEDQARKSVKYWLMSKKEKQEVYGKRLKAVDPKLKKVGELIGRAEWPNAKFQTSGK